MAAVTKTFAATQIRNACGQQPNTFPTTRGLVLNPGYNCSAKNVVQRRGANSVEFDTIASMTAT